MATSKYIYSNEEHLGGKLERQDFPREAETGTLSLQSFQHKSFPMDLCSLPVLRDNWAISFCTHACIPLFILQHSRPNIFLADYTFPWIVLPKVNEQKIVCWHAPLINTDQYSPIPILTVSKLDELRVFTQYLFHRSSSNFRSKEDLK